MTSTSNTLSREVPGDSHVESDDGSPRSHYAILVDAAGLPDDAGKLILTTIRQTRLSPGEQACVAEELIAHFADGLEAGDSLDDLIEAFGDTRTTATLIRRAKQRCCPKPRFTSWAVQSGIAFLIALSVGVAHFILIFITPKLEALYADAGAVFPDLMQVTIEAAAFLGRFYLWALFLATVIGLFEWKCRSEYKEMRRTALLLGLSLMSVIGVLWLCLVHVVGLALIAPVV